MKKLISIILSLSMLLSLLLFLSSCNKANNDEENESNESENNEGINIEDKNENNKNNENEESNENKEEIVTIDLSRLETVNLEEYEKTNALKEEQAIVFEKCYENDYSSAKERLEAEKALGYIETVSKDEFNIHVNKYTGMLYYENTESGEILVSNPYDYSECASVYEKNKLKNQINVNLNKNEYTYDFSSSEDVYITTEKTQNGIKVNYAIGKDCRKFLLPDRITAKKLEEILLVPMLKKLVALMEEYCAGEGYEGEYNVFENSEYNNENLSDFEQKKQNLYYKEYLNLRGVRNYIEECKSICKEMYEKDSDEYKAILEVCEEIVSIYAATSNVYVLKNPAATSSTVVYDQVIEQYYSGDKNLEIYETLEPMYILNAELNSAKANLARIFLKYVKDYTVEDMFYDEIYCGCDNYEIINNYVYYVMDAPIVKCSIEYSLNESGNLSVKMNAENMTYDKDRYEIAELKIIENFGITGKEQSTVTFATDGSATIIKFEDFYK